jgi:hypothetical protein
MVYYTSFAAIPVVIGILLFAIIANATMISAQQGSIITDKVPPLPTSKLHAVKIISPAKGQQVPIGKDLTVSGITSTGAGNATSHCQVSIIANGVKPYQQANGTGPGGKTDYSKWNFIVTSNYTSIKPGPNNKITAKYVCNSNPGALSFYSVNVTGGSPTALAVAAPHTSSVIQTEQPVGSSTSADRNSTSTSSASTKYTSSALHSTKLAYLGESKSPGSTKHTSSALHSTKLAYLGESKSPGSTKHTSSALHSTKLAYLGQGHHHRAKSLGLQSASALTTGLTSDSRSIDKSRTEKSESIPFIFPFGPG